MPLDASKIGQVVAEQMEALEGRFGDDCQIGDVCTIVEVLGPHGSQAAVRPVRADRGERAHGRSDVRPHGLIGLLRMAETMALSGVRGEPAEGE